MQFVDVCVVQEFQPVEFDIVLIGKTEQDFTALFYLGIMLKVDCQVLNPFSLFLLCSSFLEKIKSRSTWHRKLFRHTSLPDKNQTEALLRASYTFYWVYLLKKLIPPFRWDYLIKYKDYHLNIHTSKPIKSQKYPPYWYYKSYPFLTTNPILTIYI